MKRLIIVLAVLALCVAASAKLQVATPTYEFDQDRDIVATQIWFDDMESGPGAWFSYDATASAGMHFHVTTFKPYAGGGVYNWYCGDETLTADGGYANSWDDRLDLPVIAHTGTFPVWTFAYRYDSEVDYDFTYVQAESLGVWANLNKGFNGSSGGWQDFGMYGYQMAAYDDPMVARYRFVSDGAWSDGDGDGDTDGGAFAVDNIKVFDFISGTIEFYDDVEDGVGLCTPSIPAAAGDYWTIVEDYCSSYSPVHSWNCNAPGDSTFIPPNLNNQLYTPIIDVSSVPVTADSILFRHLMHCQIPTVDNDYWTEFVSMDGGASFTQTAAWWGDFGTCDGWMGTPYYGYRIDTLGAGPFTYVWIMHTTDNGATGDPLTVGSVGINLDDTWIEYLETIVPVEEKSWGSIKAMYQ